MQEQETLALHNPIRASEWFLCLSGITILIGLSLDWDAGASGFMSLGVPVVLALLLAVASLPVPLMLRMTMKSDVPIVWETLLLVFSAVVSAVLMIKGIIGISDGPGVGFWVVLGGCLVNTISSWYAVSREN